MVAFMSVYCFGLVLVLLGIGCIILFVSETAIHRYCAVVDSQSERTTAMRTIVEAS